MTGDKKETPGNKSRSTRSSHKIRLKKKNGTITLDNYNRVWTYILKEIESGRWQFADWPLENLQEIPLTPDAEGRALKELDEWTNRHLKPDTQEKMFAALEGKTDFDIKKAVAEILISEKTRDQLRKYRDQTFGKGKGSMEVTIRQLLDSSVRTLPPEIFQKLASFQRKNNLSSPTQTIQKLLELAETPQEAPPPPTPTPPPSPSLSSCEFVKEEISRLLEELKQPLEGDRTAIN